MRKLDRHSILFLAFAAFLFLAAIFLPKPAAAAGTKVVDDAGILSSSQVQQLTEKLEKVSSAHNVDVVIYTNQSLEGYDAKLYAADFYDYEGYSENGIVYMLSMEGRDWAISTKGTCIKAFTDAGQNWITDQLRDLLHENNYYDAFMKFADYADDFLKQYEKGKPYDSGNLPKKPFNGIRDTIISILAGLGIGFGRASLLKADTKTVKEAKNATGYIAGSEITGASDYLVHTEFRRIERSSSGGGGSSTFTSSSGATHGGSSGKF